MPSHSIVDSQLWIRLDFGIAIEANELFERNPSNRAHLAAQLLLYDRVVVPTKDFGIIPILISWMGLAQFREALEADALGFVRPRALLGYVGNGKGIADFEIRDSREKPFAWHQAATFGPLEEAVDLQLRHGCSSLSETDRASLVRLCVSKTAEARWSGDEFDRHIIHESYTDVMGSTALRSFVLAHEPPSGSSVRLPALSGVGPTSMRILNRERIHDAVDLVLRVAEINLEVLMAHLYGEADIGTSRGAEHLLRQKLARAGALPELIQQFQSLLQLENIPDVRALVAGESVSVGDIWKIRQASESRRFRAWLREANPADARELEKAYVSALGRASVYSSLPVRILRFVLTTAVGAVEPVTGTLTGAIDSFFIEKWLGGYSPRLFLERVRALPSQSPPGRTGA